MRAVLWAVVALAWLAACGDEELAGGSGSQTTNTIAGVFVNANGQAQAGVRVRMVPSTYEPFTGQALPTSWADTTDARGRWDIAGLVDGEYALEAEGGSEGSGFAAMGLRLRGGESSRRGTDTLGSPGTIAVRLSAAERLLGGWLYVPGTTYRALVPAGAAGPGVTRMEPLPAGKYATVAFARADGANYSVAGGPFLVRPGAVTPAGPFAAWKSAWRVNVRAGADGAGLRESVRDFPLLIKLDSTFNFAACRGDGADVRLADGSGAPLPMDVERWDSAGRRAELWTRLDSVAAGADIGLWLFAGHPGSAPVPGPAFDTSAGFAAVWHMQRILPSAVPDTGVFVPDATPNHLDAASRNGAGTPFAEGPAGSALLFDGVDDFLDAGAAPALSPREGFTLEAWIRPARLPHTGTGFDDAMVIAKFDAYSLELQADGSTEAWVRTGPAKDAFTLRSPVAAIAADAWTHMAATYDGVMLRSYADGVLLAEIPAAGAVSLVGTHTLIGYIEGWPGIDRYFAGAVDEARISRRARSQEWLRLGFETQKPGSRNVTVEAAAE